MLFQRPHQLLVKWKVTTRGLRLQVSHILLHAPADAECRRIKIYIHPPETAEFRESHPGACPRRLDSFMQLRPQSSSLVQSYSSGCAMDRFAHAPHIPGDVEGYSVTAQMAGRIDMMLVANE